MRDLIPLYLNGALRGPERARFEMRIQHDAALRRELDEFAEIEAAFRAMEDRVGVDLHKVLRAVQARVRREPRFRAASMSELARPLQWLKELLLRPAVGWSVAAAQLAVIAVLVMGVPQRTQGPAETLTDSTVRSQPAIRRIHIVFAPNATQESVQRLLQDAGVRISDGPNEVGAYTLEMRPGARSAAETLEILRTSQIVVFAELAY